MLFKVLICVLLVDVCVGGSQEMFSEEDISVEIPKKHGSQPNNIFPVNEDMVFNFIHKLVDTAHKSSAITLRRIQKDADKREKLQEEIGDIISTFKNTQLPLVDNLPHLIPNNNKKQQIEVIPDQKEHS